MDTIEVSKIKELMQEEMSHMLAILRDILTSLHREEKALKVEDFSGFDTLIKDRFLIIDSFNQWNKKFSQSLLQLQNELHYTEEKVSIRDIAADLRLLHEMLSEEDFGLLLLHDQLVGILEEIQKQSNENHNIMESHEGRFHSHLQHLNPQLLTPKKTIVGVLDKPE